MAELGLNEHHQNEVINYMRFARSRRGLRLKTVDSCFQDLKESRLVEETFTVDEVSEVLSGLQAVVYSEVESELINTAHTNVLLLRQLFSQAEKWYLKLQTDISELENRELLEQVAEFEKAEFTSSNKKPILDTLKPKLAPLNEGGTELLNKDFIKAQDLNDLENTVAALKSEFQKTLNDKTENQKSLEENLATAKHDLLRVQEQLSMAEKELDKKFQQTAAYRNMKEILTRKNDQIKDLRRRLAKYEPED
ncbi:leucine zipper transcription factor-like protein 1 isoform X3 [Prionailurus viverrinus]|uniref:leucine zipper transcription factor-like protein 1 isoform X3 n=1 Tax=Prionailurus viverrinus TaxID=61388 RepID=UPI001FF4CF09|nr:leucine zipper transcription factor-like protein 1 isoform X3 [Prionailurus viverrinus]